MEEEKITKELKKQVEDELKKIKEKKVQENNVDYLYKLIDIHKDIEEEDNMKMRYGNYSESMGRYNESMGAGNMGGYSESMGGYGENMGNYGRRGVPGSGRGRYRESSYSAGGNYGRRGVDSKYRGEEALNNMYQAYGEYSEGKEMYGNDQETMESFKYMLKSFKDYYKHLKQEASSQEEVKLLEQTAREIGNM